ncbi:malate dehydrogenase, mitochondrial-like [Venturia canescens]|uniref:malate dehydrogenase, mitochondrial-like n=1 Tax=Venturia canescens TaxID=32260 RepID=UPI001C9CCDC7|nr:malate dehydrogenase, mitochondrial-like [Venturia canescens]
MTAQGFKHVGAILSRNFTLTSNVRSKSMKVTVFGAAGRTGSCLSLFLKQTSLIDELAIYDKVSVAPLALELSHIDTKPRVTHYESNEEGLKRTLDDTKILVITAGEACDGKHSTNDAFMANAKILMDLIPNVIKYCPTALVALATSPMNQLVPLIVEIYKKHGFYDYNRIFGITAINSMRANKFAAEIIEFEPECVMVPVIGGNCCRTCVPVFSQMKPRCEFTHNWENFTRSSKEKGNSSLSMGFAAARFCISLCKALVGERDVVEFAYTRSCVIPEVTYFAGPLELGPSGIQKYLGVPPLTNEECKNLECAIPHLREAITAGEALVLGPRQSSTETCPQHPDICGQEISGKMQKSDKFSQPCPI